jgi:hypothetical protein
MSKRKLLFILFLGLITLILNMEPSEVAFGDDDDILPWADKDKV